MTMNEDDLIVRFWEYKEYQLGVEFSCKYLHTPEEYLQIRGSIRERRENRLLPKKGTTLFTDWYSFKANPNKDALFRMGIMMPSDECLQKYYENEILPRKAKAKAKAKSTPQLPDSINSIE